MTYELSPRMNFLLNRKSTKNSFSEAVKKISKHTFSKLLALSTTLAVSSPFRPLFFYTQFHPRTTVCSNRQGNVTVPPHYQDREQYTNKIPETIKQMFISIRLIKIC